MMLGGAFVAGWTVADVLDLSWDQIGLVGESMALFRAKQVEMIATPVMGALGKKARRRPTRVRSSNPSRNLTPEQKDAVRLHNIGAAGFSVHTSGSSTE